MTIIGILVVLLARPVTYAQLPQSAVEVALYEAFVLVGAAAERTDSTELRSIAERMLEREPHVRALLADPGNEWSRCQDEPRLQGFVRVGENRIQVCRRILKQVSFSRLAQMLVHELAHVIGVQNECEAYRIEVGIVGTVYLEGPFKHKSPYEKECRGFKFGDW